MFLKIIDFYLSIFYVYSDKCGVGLKFYKNILFIIITRLKKNILIMNSQSLKEDVVLERINKKCQECNLTFLGFNNKENKYVNTKTKLKLKCNVCEHTWDTTTYEKFMVRKNKCLKCHKKVKLTKKEKIKKINKRCEELDYTFLGFTDTDKLILKCNKCGVEWNTTSYDNFLKTDRKSHKCGRKNPTMMPQNFKDRDEIKKQINKKLKNSNLEFVDFVEKEMLPTEKYHVYLKCKLCGEIKKHYLHYLLNTTIPLKCKVCENFNKRKNDDVIRIIEDKCELLGYTFLGFDNKLNRYINKKTKLKLKCNKCGYKWNTTSFYTFNHSCVKCYNCTNCWKMEKEVKYFLDKHHIKYEEQKMFDWLKYKNKLRLDFFLPEYDIAIECQGIQHFEPNERFGGEKDFKETQRRDKIKHKLCKDNNLKLLYFNNEDNVSTFLGEKVITKIKDLKTIIYG